MLPRTLLVLLIFLTTVVTVAAGSVDLDEGSPRRLAVSPDGQRIAVASGDRVVRVWDATTGRLLHTLELDQPGTAVAFAPDGGVLLAGTSGTRSVATEPTRGHLYAWSITAGEVKLRWRAPIVGQVMGLAVEPGGQWCAAITVYARLGIYSLENGTLRRNWSELGNSPSDVAVSPDGKTIVTAGQAFILWDTTQEKRADEIVDAEKPLDAQKSQRFIRAQKAGSIATAIAADGKWAVAVGYFVDAQGRPIDVVQLDMTSAQIMRIIAKGIHGTTCIALSPDDTTVALGLNSGMIKVFNIVEQKQVAEWQLHDMENIRSIAYLAGGKQLAIASHHGHKVILIDASTGIAIKQLWPEK